MANTPTIYYDQSLAIRRESYDDYLRTQSQTKELTGSIRENIDRLAAATVATGALTAQRIGSAIQAAQSANEDAMREEASLTRLRFSDDIASQTHSMNMTMSYGFAGVEQQIGAMGAEMNFGLARLNDTFQKSAQNICDKLDAINDTLNNPRFTEARELYRQASTEYGKGFFEDARNDLLKATTLYKADAISWRLLGMVYLFGAGELAGEFNTVVDLDAAIAAWFNAAKYIEPDAKAHEEARGLAAEIYFHLGLARLFKSNDLLSAKPDDPEVRRFLNEARQSFEQSWAYSDKMLEARYNAARCKTLLGDTNGAMADLEAVLTKDGRYGIKAATESDFDAIRIREDYKLLIEKKRSNLYREAASLLAKIKAEYEKAQADGLEHHIPIRVRSEIAHISDGISADLPYLDMWKRGSAYSASLTRLQVAVREAASAKRQADEVAAEQNRQADEAAVERKKQADEAAVEQKKQADEAAVERKKQADEAKRRAEVDEEFRIASIVREAAAAEAVRLKTRNKIIRSIIGSIIGVIIGFILGTAGGSLTTMFIGSVIGVVVGIFISSQVNNESSAVQGAGTGAFCGAISFAIFGAIFSIINGLGFFTYLICGAIFGAIGGAIIGAFCGGMFSDYKAEQK